MQSHPFQIEANSNSVVIKTELLGDKYAIHNGLVPIRVRQKEIFLVHGFLRSIQNSFESCTPICIIPAVINSIICLFYAPMPEQLSWSKKHYTKASLVLEKGDTLVRHSSGSGYAYVNADIEPITQGTHCFRVMAHSESRNTVFFSFMRYAEDDRYKYSSFYSAPVYGTTTHGYIVWDGVNTNKGLQNPSQEYQLDLWIDCEAKVIKIGFVKDVWADNPTNLSEIVHEDIPEWTWIPHFNIYDSNAYLKILRIHPSLYRKPDEYADKLLADS